MKILVAFLILFPSLAFSQEKISYIDEARMLGSIAGQGMACKSPRYETFELLARAIVLSKAPNEAMQNRGLQNFLEEKANSYISVKDYAKFDCPDIISRFEKQEIFNAKLYADGTISFADGTIVTPAKTYDAKSIY